MNNCIEKPAEISKALKVWFLNSPETQESIELSTGVDQSQISRILAGDFTRITPKVRAICKYAKITLVKMPVDPANNPRIMAALEQTWDGTTAHANIIAKVILALAKYRK